MSCCGTAKTQGVNRQEVNLSPSTPIAQQPSPHPGALFPEKQSFTAPSISPPPAAHTYNSLNGHQSPPPSSLTSTSPPPMIPQFNSFNGDLQSQPLFDPSSMAPPFQDNLLRPSPTYPGSVGSRPSAYSPQAISVMPSSNAGFSPPLSDEGKMSISIDFGMSSIFSLPQMDSVSS